MAETPDTTTQAPENKGATSQPDKETSTTPDSKEVEKTQAPTKEDNLNKLGKENKKLQKELDKYKKLEEESTNKKLEEDGNYKELLGKKDKELRELRSNQSVIDSLSKESLNPEFSQLAREQITSKLTYSESGEIENLSESVESVKTAYPSFFTQPEPQKAGGVGSGVANQGNAGNNMSADQAYNKLQSGNLSAEDIASSSEQFMKTIQQQ